ncbi:MAG TPA: hypothetical protein VMO26_25580 [Vicinamibacterales bacterium]|nr:hypothetical protein [Vicinamibacterales bacterium]
MTASTGIAIGAIVAAASIAGALELRSRDNVVTVGFWFEDVTFELHDPARMGGPLTPGEQQRIQTVARQEIEHAFAEFRLRLTDRRDAFYRVRVRQWLTVGRYAVAGQSNVFGPLGGYGAVSFVTLAAQAMAHAPAGASRANVVDAIGRGLGRAAVHEFAHQILPKGPMHNTRDRESYEYWSSDRAAQYYGEMHWSVARPKLRERLARE